MNSLPKLQSGFTMVGVMIAISVVAALAILQSKSKTYAFIESSAKMHTSETNNIRSAIQIYRSQTGAWPGQNSAQPCSNAISVLTSAVPPILIEDGVNRLGNNYVISCPGGAAANYMTIQETVSPRVAPRFVEYMGGARIVNANNGLVETIVYRNGFEPGLVGKVNRDGTTPITANWDMSGGGGFTPQLSGISLLTTRDVVLENRIRSPNSNKAVNLDGISELTDVELESLNFQRYSQPFAGCSPNGSLGSTLNGSLLECYKGTWQPVVEKTGGSFQRFYTIGPPLTHLTVKATNCSLSNGQQIAAWLSTCHSGGGCTSQPTHYTQAMGNGDNSGNRDIYLFGDWIGTTVGQEPDFQYACTVVYTPDY